MGWGKGGGASIRQGAFMPSRLTVRFDTKEFALKIRRTDNFGSHIMLQEKRSP